MRAPTRPSLAPSDFWQFGHAKMSLICYVFTFVNELLEAVIKFLDAIQPLNCSLFFTTGSSEMGLSQ
jgi:hypothetical protein